MIEKEKAGPAMTHNLRPKLNKVSLSFILPQFHSPTQPVFVNTPRGRICIGVIEKTDEGNIFKKSINNKHLFRKFDAFGLQQNAIPILKKADVKTLIFEDKQGGMISDN